MPPEIRPVTPADTEACGRIIFEAFKGIADQHGFPWDFPSVEAGAQLATTFIEAPSIYGVVAELDGRVVGSNFMAGVIRSAASGRSRSTLAYRAAASGGG